MLNSNKITKEFFNDLMKEFFSQNFPEMSIDDSKSFLVLAFDESVNEEIKDKEIKEFLDKEFMPQVIKKRLKYVLGKDITDQALLFLSSILDSPGKSTMMTACISYKLDDPKVTLKNLGEKVFPHGFPTNEQWNKLWNKQKVLRVNDSDPDNMLDYEVCYH